QAMWRHAGQLVPLEVVSGPAVIDEREIAVRPRRIERPSLRWRERQTDLAADMARAARVAEEFAALGALDLEGHEGTAHAHAVRGRLDPADAEVRAHTRFPARRGLGIELLVESGRTAR